MRLFLIAFAAACMALLATSFQYAGTAGTPLNKKIYLEQKRLQMVRCSPDWSSFTIADSTVQQLPLLPGWGNYKWAISTKNDSAQLYFNQGISMYYAFHIVESLASFLKAQRFDSTCAMLYWAEALAYGPNINDFEYTASPAALKAVKKAVALSVKSSQKEKILINAMAVRYSPDTSASRSALNQAYTNKMKEAYLQINADADIAALYADAMMQQHPWDLWQHDGKAKPWTGTIESVLEKLLKQSPDHPGANHYYVHTMEASPQPQKALASADKLGSLMPDVSHLVHMPSHIYIRTGNYNKGEIVNENAVKGFNIYLGLYPGVAANAPLYLIHNLHMQSASAMMDGNYQYAIKTALACRNSFDTSLMSLPAPMNNYVQYVYMSPVFIQIRFGKWDDILNASAIPGNYVYAAALAHFAKGLAHAKKSQHKEAINELNKLKELMKDPSLAIPLKPFNSALEALQVAEKILDGNIAEEQVDLTLAVDNYKDAVSYEDAMIYNEPKDWLIPARHYLGAALLKKENPAEAEDVFKEDLKENPKNGWALFGLYQSLLSQNKNTAASSVLEQFKKAFIRNDVKPSASVF